MTCLPVFGCGQLLGSGQRIHFQPPPPRKASNGSDAREPINERKDRGSRRLPDGAGRAGPRARDRVISMLALAGGRPEAPTPQGPEARRLEAPRKVACSVQRAARQRGSSARFVALLTVRNALGMNH